MKHLLDRIRVDAGLTSAAVDDRQVEADGPKELRSALATALYDVLHAGRAEAPEGVRASTRDPAFERELSARVPHRLSPETAPADPDRPGVVRLGGVRVRVAESCAERSAREIMLPAVLPALSPGFLLVNGSRGHGTHSHDCLRLYAGAESADAAPELWGALVGALEEQQVPYRAKVLSSREHYPRRDAIVVYLGPQAWPAVPAVAAAVTAVGGLRRDVSAYTAELAPGLGWAWEPRDERPGMSGLSFGEHRSRALAAGVVTHAERGGDRDLTVAGVVREAGIDAAAVHRNLGSPLLPFETSRSETGAGDVNEHPKEVNHVR